MLAVARNLRMERDREEQTQKQKQEQRNLVSFSSLFASYIAYVAVNAVVY